VFSLFSFVSFTQARRVFEKMCPGEEFLPKPPNAEDIIYDDGETAGEMETGFESKADTVTAVDGNIETETGEDNLHGVNCAADKQEGIATAAVTEDGETRD